MNALEDQARPPLHVVIKLPFPRPKDFVEPPPILWTERLEREFWHLLGENKGGSADWSRISRQLGVPTAFLIRHAAFHYENQLRELKAHIQVDKPTDIDDRPPLSITPSQTDTALSAKPAKEVQRGNESENDLVEPQAKIDGTEASIPFSDVPKLEQAEIASLTSPSLQKQSANITGSLDTREVKSIDAGRKETERVDDVDQVDQKYPDELHDKATKSIDGFNSNKDATSNLYATSQKEITKGAAADHPPLSALQSPPRAGHSTADSPTISNKGVNKGEPVRNSVIATNHADTVQNHDEEDSVDEFAKLSTLLSSQIITNADAPAFALLDEAGLPKRGRLSSTLARTLSDSLHSQFLPRRQSSTQSPKGRLSTEVNISGHPSSSTPQADKTPILQTEDSEVNSSTRPKSVNTKSSNFLNPMPIVTAATSSTTKAQNTVAQGIHANSNDPTPSLSPRPSTSAMSTTSGVSLLAASPPAIPDVQKSSEAATAALATASTLTASAYSYTKNVLGEMRREHPPVQTTKEKNRALTPINRAFSRFYPLPSTATRANVQPSADNYDTAARRLSLILQSSKHTKGPTSSRNNTPEHGDVQETNIIDGDNHQRPSDLIKQIASVSKPTQSPLMTQSSQPSMGDRIHGGRSDAHHSVGSSFSDISDASVTQSALEDAYLSKFNNGSKTSLFSFARGSHKKDH